MNNPHTSTCSAVSEDSQLPLAGLDTEPLPSASRTTTAPKSSTDTGPMCRSSQTSETLTGASGAGPDCSQEDFLANLSVLPGSDEARRMTVRSGLKCSALLKKQDPVGCLVKTLLESSTWHSTMCFLNWKAKGTPQGRLYFQLAPSTPRTDETGCGLLDTPTAMLGNNQRPWPSTMKQGNTTASVYKLLPTPQASDNRNRGNLTNPSVQRRLNIGKQVSLNQLWAGQLNPQFVEQMMGYPIAHTDLKPSETPSSRK